VSAVLEVLEDMPDVDWMRALTQAFSWSAPKGMNVFPTTELDATRSWAAD